MPVQWASSSREATKIKARSQVSLGNHVVRLSLNFRVLVINYLLRKCFISVNHDQYEDVVLEFGDGNDELMLFYYIDRN